jgi:hypothetical protein
MGLSQKEGFFLRKKIDQRWVSGYFLSIVGKGLKVLVETQGALKV